MHRILICLLLITVTQLYAFSKEYTCKKLKSGQTVIVAEIKDNPIVSINSWVRTGSINENDSNSGAAHFLEHLFFKGSKNVPTGEFDKILESKGAVTNAATSKDYTQFYITIPSSEFELALKLHSDMLLNPLIPTDELEKERFVVLEEIARGLDNPSNVLYNNLFKLVYNNHPYMRPVIGTKEVISNISREEIFDFYNNWYVPSNMITVISGDIDADYAIKQVEKAFSAGGAKTKTPNYPSISPITKQISINENKETAQGYMAIAYRVPKFTGGRDTFALDILSVILGESNSSVLNTELKEKKQLVSGINASNAQYLDDGMFIVSAKFEPLKNVTEIQNAIFDEIEKIKNTGITSGQLQKAKNMIRTSTEFSRESALNIAQELGFFAFYYNNPKMYNEYLKKIDSITANDVVRAANKYLDREKTAISTVLPKGYVEISEISSRPKTELGAPIIIEKTENETKYSINNNATLIVRKNKQNSIIALDIYAKGGSFLSGKPGVSYLAAKSALRGTKNRTYDEINNFLDENGIDFSINSNPDAFNISLLTAKNRLNEAIEILDEVINYPSFSDAEINKVKKQYAEYVNSLSDRPLALAMDEFNGAAYRGYPYSYNNQTTIKYINDITRDEIAGYYNKILDSKNLVITLVGDVDENMLIREFERIFKNKNQKKIEIKDFLKTSYVPNVTYKKKIKNEGKETSWIILGYKTCPVYDIKENAVLRVIDSLMGTGMSSRLFSSLREEKGLAYQVGSQISRFANDSAFVAYIGTNFKNETAALNGINLEFDKLKKEMISDTELKEAKDKLLGNMILGLETNMDKAEFLVKYTAFGFKLNYLDELRKEIENVTSKDIISFANKYFNKPHFEIIVGK